MAQSAGVVSNKKITSRDSQGRENRNPTTDGETKNKVRSAIQRKACSGIRD